MKKSWVSLLLLLASLTAFAVETGPIDSILRMPHTAGQKPAMGTIDLSRSNAVGSSILAVPNGGTGIVSGTSGGVPYYSGTTAITSSGALTANGVVLGGGSGSSPTSTTAGTAYQLFRNGSGGAPAAFGSMDLSQSSAVGATILGEANGGTGLSSYPTRPTDNRNYSLTASVSSNNLTVALKDASGSDASATSPVKIAFRHTTQATGQYLIGSVTAALSVTGASGASFGTTSAVPQVIWVYAQYNSGTVELCLKSLVPIDEALLQTTTTISSGATANNVVYCSTGRSTQPLRLLGEIILTEATAGTYATSPTTVAVAPFDGHAMRTGSPVPARLEWFTVAPSCSSSPCTIAAQSGSWIGSTAIVRNSTGNYTITFLSNTWSSAPICTYFCSGGGGINIATQPTTSSVTFTTVNTGGTASDSGFGAICAGLY